MLDAAIQSTKQMAANIRRASELWELELPHATPEGDCPQVRMQILGLLMVFGDLIREGKLNASDLKGLAEDKIAHIRWEATRSNMGIC